MESYYISIVRSQNYVSNLMPNADLVQYQDDSTMELI